MDRFRDLAEFLDKFLKFQFVVIAFLATATGGEFSTKHPHVMMVLVFMIMLFFLLWLLGIVLQNRIERLREILFWIMLVIGGVSSVLVFTIINSVTALLALLFWVGIFAVIAYDNSEELYPVFVSPVSNIINRLIQSYRPADARPSV